MEREQPKAAAANANALMERIRAADTPENEAKLISKLAERDVRITRKNKKSAARYRVIFPNGSSIEPATLLDLEAMCVKMRIVID